MSLLIANSAPAAAGYFAGKQVVPIDYQAEVSQRLVDAAHAGDLPAAQDCMSDPFVDVNFVGTVSLRSKRTEIVLRGESSHEVRAEYEEFRTEVTALFLSAHAGNLTLVRKLLSAGASVNQKLFRGYAITAAVREGHVEIVEVLINAGACQKACEEALLEASYVGKSRCSELLVQSEMIRPQFAVRALIVASSRGFLDVVRGLVACGVDANATDRVLLQSSKPSLHINMDCSALVAAVIGRQVAVVRLLLQAGVRTDIKVRLGAWSWDVNTGEEFRVGAGLAEPYPVAWCAVEYFESSGAILQMLLRSLSSESPHYGRSLVHHAILCQNGRALNILLKSGGDVECPIKTASRTEHPIHVATRLGVPEVLRCLISAGCDVNSRSDSDETALMVCARSKQEECLKILASAGADLSLVNSAGQSASSIAESAEWSLYFHKAVLVGLGARKVGHSSNAHQNFSTLMPLNEANGSKAIKESAAKCVDIYVCSESDDKSHSGPSCTSSSLLSEPDHNSEVFNKTVLEDKIDDKDNDSLAVKSLHRAARDGDIDLLRALLTGGSEVDTLDPDGYTPLMLAAKGGHRSVCELLISCGANCEIENDRHETALTIARRSGTVKNEVVRVIFDQLARKLVLRGGQVKKHTKCGKGSPHVKTLRMVGGSGVLRWGKSSKRNVICKRAEVGPSAGFRWNRRKKLDLDEPGLFRVVTTRNKEVHFVCEGGDEMAQLWVRGIEIMTREAIFGNK
ncbi:serine/threonine-protein phosphatase 6 regulatory ankyrin repeat subunit C-like [Punica granatum]|uniref:Serine/threonine-protein phosphatase 6 regulatory ankyrin repeat subunit C-like n=1 Tax=Punica granatum TaxID=22663 RepID=A0A218WTU5_PUNGR|nr:serine/threonine-protein phosphatase 6 regulatory ankyrin repeat subunit C-like [Punica granatum]OWM76195.1 hypothetical protein CDL15_Pgr009841 [Punica granatum]